MRKGLNKRSHLLITGVVFVRLLRSDVRLVEGRISRNTAVTLGRQGSDDDPVEERTLANSVRRVCTAYGKVSEQREDRHDSRVVGAGAAV